MHPRILGRYEIIRELGRGGMGRVYLARDPEIDRPVAIKLVEFESLTNSREQEARQALKGAFETEDLFHWGPCVLLRIK